MWSLLISIVLSPLFITATPVPVPNPEPVSADAFADFPVNVIMLAGAAEFGVWVPADGLWHSTATLTCLNAGANSYGSCSIPSVDHVGVTVGNGPCTFLGTSGFEQTLSGDAGEGFQWVAPPQQLSMITCGY